MSDKKRIAGIIEKVKEITHDLDAHQKESLKDQLLAYLLFGNYNDLKGVERIHNGQLQGLTDKERDLIKKLAAQTEALYKAKHENEDDCD